MASGTQIDDVRCAIGNTIEVVHRQRHTGLVRDRQQVENGVG